MDTDNILIRKQKAKGFFDKKIPVHIVTESDKWVNGYIKEVGTDFFVVIDRLHGEQIVFFLEIRIFEQFEGDYSTLKEVQDE